MYRQPGRKDVGDVLDECKHRPHFYPQDTFYKYYSRISDLENNKFDHQQRGKHADSNIGSYRLFNIKEWRYH